MQSHDVGIVYLNPAQLKMKIVSMKKADGKQTNKICPWHKLWALHTLFHIHKLHFATQTSRTTNITFKLQENKPFWGWMSSHLGVHQQKPGYLEMIFWQDFLLHHPLPCYTHLWIWESKIERTCFKETYKKAFNLVILKQNTDGWSYLPRFDGWNYLRIAAWYRNK